MYFFSATGYEGWLKRPPEKPDANLLRHQEKRFSLKSGKLCFQLFCGGSDELEGPLDLRFMRAEAQNADADDELPVQQGG